MKLRRSRSDEHVGPAYRPPASSPEPRPFPEPWRQHHLAPSCVALPVATVVAVADPKTLAQIRRREASRLDELRADIAANGVRKPLVMVVDHLGHVALQDGHHRTAVCEELRNARLGPERLPVRFVRSEGVSIFNVEARAFVGPALLASPRDDETLRRAAAFALEAIEDAGERGWALGDAVCALRLELGLDVTSDAADRMRRIDPWVAGRN